MNYDQAIRYLLSLTDLERDPRRRPPGSAFQLERMRAFLDRLGSPDAGRGTVHVAGSKGKGSTASMIAAVLSRAGSTGLYTSPHLHSFCERVAVDGRPIAEEYFGRLVEEQQTAAEDSRLVPFGRVTTFEHLTALAFRYFQEQGCGWQVIEVGLGGRLDATNALLAKDCCVLTSISLDHTAILGSTAEQIAAEKAGILRPAAPAVIAPQRHAGALAVLVEQAARLGSPVVDVAREYRWRSLGSDEEGQEALVESPSARYRFRLPLLGAHQLENAATAVAAVETLSRERLAVEIGTIEAGLASVRWPGRMEVIRGRPRIVLDGAHNRDSTSRLREGLESHFRFRRLLLVVGMSSDKDIAGIAEELAPAAAAVICTRSNHPRAADPSDVAAVFASRGVEARTAPSVAEALSVARAAAGEDDLICVMGSLFVVADAREALLGAPRPLVSLV